MATPEDIDRSVTALEKAQSTEREIVRAVSEVLAESERRRLQMQISTPIDASEKRVREAVNAAQREIASQMNDFEQRITAALDGLALPPR
jgi:hypothetical protein